MVYDNELVYVYHCIRDIYLGRERSLHKTNFSLDERQ